MLSSLFDVGEYDYNHVRMQPLWNDFRAKRKSLAELADAAVKMMNVDQRTAKTIYKRLQTYSKNHKIKQGQAEVEIVPDDRPIYKKPFVVFHDNFYTYVPCYIVFIIGMARKHRPQYAHIWSREGAI